MQTHNVRKNEIYEVTITDQTLQGQGICRIDGFLLFVPGAAAGDHALVRVLKVNTAYGFARVEELLVPSVDRVEPPCPVYTRCGGCALMHLRYEAQLELKTQAVKDALSRIGGIAQPDVKPCLGMTEPWRYRNKMIFPLAASPDGKVQFGFYAPRSHRLVPLSDCLIGDERAARSAQVVCDFANEHGWTCYDEQTHEGLLRRVFVRTVKNGMLVVISGAGDPPREAKQLAALLCEQVSGITGVVWNRNTDSGNAVLGKQNELLWGSELLEAELLDLRFHLSPQSFLQVNTEQTEVLYQAALDAADLQPTDRVVDLYCGIGTLSLCAAKQAGQVIGIEIVPQAIANARHNAALNGLKNAEFYAEDAGSCIARLLEEGLSADVVILDPPRKGADEATLNGILRLSPQRVVYVSCDPATLARDVKFLCAHGYRFLSAQPVDLFCHTGHVETVVLMSRVEK